MEPQKTFFPDRESTELFDRKASGKFQNDLYNLALDKDVAKKRNLLYLGLIIVCVLSTIFIAATANYKTYVVRVDNATGQVETGGELKATNYKPQEAELKTFLAQFIMNTRTIPLDPVQYRVNWENSKHFLTQEAAQKLVAMTDKEKPVNKLGHLTVQPEIKSIQLQPGTQSTYQVRWIEEEYALSGGKSGEKASYVALFTIKLDPPTKEQELLINPLGLKIKDLTMTRENETKG